MGLASQLCGEYSDAADCFRQALRAWPGDAALHAGLGMAEFELGQTDRAIASLRRSCGLAPSVAPGWFNLGEALKRGSYPDEASGALLRAVTLDPAHLAARLSLAQVQASLGNIEAATRGFREVLLRDAGNARAWFGLAELGTVHLDAAETVRLEQAFARSGKGSEEHDLLGFALAKACEARGDYARAFELFTAANASQRRQQKWDATAERAQVERIRDVFERFTTPPAGDRGHEAILIASIPRSGSTLVEQILASHPQVEGAGEIKALPAIIDAESRRRRDPFPSWVPMATAGDWQRLGEEYLVRTRRWRARKPRFVDKNLVTWRTVGAALAMLPDARVVVVRRDPVETCLACFRQRFSGDAAFAYDLDELADYCADFLRLTRFWRRKYPDRVFDLRYESLLAVPERVIGELLAFCGLPLDPACLEFHRTERAVFSAPSAAQVRQPLRRDTARAERYGDRLDGLRRRLRDAGL